jgi:NAD(P)-dependent dehydrogenase (short-subunit alcohol dehydrogenase family)
MAPQPDAAGSDDMADTADEFSRFPDYAALSRLDGRVFVVLGGGAGIGRQTCHALAQAGARVVCVDLNEAVAKEVAGEVGGVALSADVTQRSEVERIFTEAGKLGPVRGLVDIVGIAKLSPLSQVDDAGWKWQYDQVLTHAFLAMQIGGKAIADAGGGSMVFVASMSGVTYLPGQSAYGSAKAALIHLVNNMGRELGPAGVRVNAVAPGFARTPRLNEMLGEDRWKAIGDMIPVGRAAYTREIAAPILFLSTDMASHITGHTLMVDGGIANFVHLPQLW